MNNIPSVKQLNKEENITYKNIVHILRTKHIDIDNSIIIECIQDESRKDTVHCDIIDIESKLLGLEYIIKKCIDIQLKYNERNTDRNIDIPISSEYTNNILKSIIQNEHAAILNREVHEEYIYIRGVSGDTRKYTATHILNKTFTNVESIELIGGFINDSPYAPSSSVSGDGPQESDISEVGFLSDPNELFGSIGPVPFIWVDIEEPITKSYNYYTNMSINDIAGSCINCSDSTSYCSTCGISGETFTHSEPHGTFFVQLEQYNFLDHYFKGGAINTSSTSGVPAKNIVYLIDRRCSYIKQFNNLVSIDKLKLNIRNIVGKPLWGCNNELAEHDSWKQNTSPSGTEINLLRWEFIFKIKYYVPMLKNTFLLQG